MSTRVRRTGALAVAVTLITTALVATPGGAAVDAGTPSALPALSGGALHPLAPARIVDTRDGTGGRRGPLGAGASFDAQVTGVGGVPATGVGSVLLNVTATNPSVATYVTVFPTGATRPTASNLNPRAGQTVPNLVEVAVGTGGRVTIYNNSGTVDIIVDVAGWVAEIPEVGTGGLFTPLAPSRLLDTRDGTGRPGPGALGPNATISLQVTGRAGIPATGVSAVVLNVTITEPSAPTFITAWPSDVWRPLASNLNAVPGQTVPNRVTVKVGPDGRVNLYNLAGSAHLIADVGGYYTDGSDPTAIGARFTGITPVRLLDSRTASPVGPASTRRVQVAGRAGLPGERDRVPPTAAVVNVTVTEPSVPGYVTAFPSQHTHPLASDLNFTAGLTVPNLVVVQLGPDGAIDFFNMAGTTHLIVDLLGYYTGDVVVAEGLRVLSPTTAAAIASITDTSIRFGGSPADLAGLSIGDIIAAGITSTTPDGMLRIVDAVTTIDGDLVLTTHQAALDQVVQQGALHLDGSSGAGSITTPALLSGGFSVGPSFDRSLDINLDDTITAHGEIHVSATVSVDVEVGLFPPRFDAEITGQAEGNGSVSFDSQVERSVSACEDLPSVRLEPVVYAIGPVPIVITPSMQPKVCVEGEAKVGASGEGTASFTAGIRATLHNGAVSVDPFESHDLSTGTHAIPSAVTLAFSLGATVSAQIALSIDGVHILEIGPSAGVEITFNGCRIGLTAKLGLSGTLQVRFLEFESPSFPIDIPLASKEFDPIDVVRCAYWTGTYTIDKHVSGAAAGATGDLTWKTVFTVNAPTALSSPAPGTRSDLYHETYNKPDPFGCSVTETRDASDVRPASFTSEQVFSSADNRPVLELDFSHDVGLEITVVRYNSCYGTDTGTFTTTIGGGFEYFPLEAADSVEASGDRTEPIGNPGDQYTGTVTYSWALTKHCWFGVDPKDC